MIGSIGRMNEERGFMALGVYRTVRQIEVYNPNSQINRVIAGDYGFIGYLHRFYYESQAYPSGMLLQKLHRDCHIFPTPLLYCVCNIDQYYDIDLGICQSTSIYIYIYII